MKSTDVFNDTSYNLFPGVDAQIFSGEKLMIMHVVLAKDAIALAHAHPHEQLSLVLKGEAEFTIGDEKKLLKAGDAVSIPGNVEHSVVALVDTQVIDCFTPVRDDLIVRFGLAQ